MIRVPKQRVARRATAKAPSNEPPKKLSSGQKTRQQQKGDAMGSAVLGDAIGAIRDWSMAKGKKGKTPASLNQTAGNGFGSLAFGDSEQQKRLPKAAYQALRKTIAHGESLDPSIADAVAKAVKDWAVEHGATHYTHWFQPLTGITAEKHDSFLKIGRAHV